MEDSPGHQDGESSGLRDSSQPVCTFKKPAFKKKGAKQQNKRARKQASDSGSGSSSEEAEESVLLRKQQSNNTRGVISTTATKSSVLHTYASTGTASPLAVAGGATYTSEIDTEHDRDNRAMMEMALRAQQEEEDASGAGGEKIYRGQAMYRKYVPKDEAQIGGNKYTGTQGPIRAPTYLRATAVFDYKPDICKDYKETGYCGFGDGCKFMHDRSDYKSGYELEAEWEAQQKRKRQRELGEWAGSEDEEEEDAYLIKDDDELPFACFLCREGFRDPVVTVCGHYFCSPCAVEHHKNDPTCAACGEKTGGVFNFAAKLYEKMKKDAEKKKATEEKEKERAALGKESKRRKKREDGEREEEVEEEEGEEEELVIHEQDREAVMKRKKGAWSTV